MLSENPIFATLSLQQIENFLASLSLHEKKFPKGTTIYLRGDTVCDIGILMSGCLLIENLDENGSAAVIENIIPGGNFGLSYALTKKKIMVDVTAAENSVILFIPADDIIYKSADNPVHGVILCNLLRMLARKNMTLSRKIINTSPKTIRGRLISYLRERKLQTGSSSFDIPYDRRCLAEYLSCDRSQLSKEITKMKKEGLLDTSKKHFELKSDKW